MSNCDHKFVDSDRCLKCGWKPPEIKLRFEFRDGCVMARLDFAKWYLHEGMSSLSRHPFLKSVIETKLGDPGWKEVRCTYKQTGGSRRVARHTWSLEFV